MEQQPENNAVKLDDKAVTPAVSLGQTLREARERQGFSVADVAAQIKFAPRQIEALESDDYKSLPEMAFVRGFVRSYAKILKLDAQVLLANLTQAKSVSGELTPASVEVPFPDENLAQRQNLIVLGSALLLAVLVVVFAVWNYTSGGMPQKENKVETTVLLPEQAQVTTDEIAPVETVEEKTKTPEAVVPSSVRSTKPVIAKEPALPPTPSDAPPNPGTLRLEFDEESWVEIKDRDGIILSSQVYQPGGEVKIEGNMPFSVLIGHAPSVRLYFKDKQVNLAPHTRPSTDVAFLTLK